MNQQSSEEKNVGLENVAATFADDILSVELTPGLIRVALGEIRPDHRGHTVVRNSLPVAHLVMPNDTAKQLVEILVTALQQMNAVTQPGARMVVVPPRPAKH